MVNPPYPPEGWKAIPPLGIASIAGYLEENGYRGKIGLVDGFYLASRYGCRKSLEIIRDKIKRDKPFVVGFSVLYTNESEAFEIIKAAKEAESHVIVGNHMATVAHKDYSKMVTAVVRGEGELTSKELMDALFKDRDLRGIKGVTFYDGEEIVVNPDRELVDLNSLPSPAFHLLPPAGDYDLLSVEESRGCCFKCSFCSIARLYPYFRLKSPEKIRLDVENIVKLGVRDILLIGELVLLYEDRAIKVADIMGEFGCGWTIDAHPALVVKHRKILPILAEKGLKVIEIGLESGNQHSLDVYNKQTTPKVNDEAVDAALNAGIWPLLYFINFDPYLTMSDLEENIHFIIRHLRIFSKTPSYPLENLFKPWIPIPGTPLFERAYRETLVISTEKRDISSYLKMKNAKYFFLFKDEKVKKVTDLIDYFLKNYGERYFQLLGQVSEKEGSILLLNETPKATALVIVPAYVLCMAYAVVKNDLPGEVIIDWYSRQTLDSIEGGEYEKELTPLPLPKGQWKIIYDTFKHLASGAD